MKERLFRFKEFAVRHELSAMKVGVDGVLLGAWADVSGNTLLDVGTGCGLLALMALQRNPGLRVLGIDIHAPSIEEAQANAADTPWDDKVRLPQLPQAAVDGVAVRLDYQQSAILQRRCEQPER